MELLRAIEASLPAQALKSSFYVYPLVNALHIAAIGALLATVVLMDMRLLGLLRSVEAAPFIGLMRRVAVVSFGVAMLSGLALFSVRATEYVVNPAFVAKMGLIALAAVNLVAFRLAGGRAEAPGGLARASAVLSIAFWLGALIAGRFIGFL